MGVVSDADLLNRWDAGREEEPSLVMGCAAPLVLSFKLNLVCFMPFSKTQSPRFYFSISEHMLCF